MKEPCIYILASCSRTIYVDVTSNLHKRVDEHREGLVPGFTSQLQGYPLCVVRGISDDARGDEPAMARPRRGLAVCRPSVPDALLRSLDKLGTTVG